MPSSRKLAVALACLVCACGPGEAASTAGSSSPGGSSSGGSSGSSPGASSGGGSSSGSGSSSGGASSSGSSSSSGSGSSSGGASSSGGGSSSGSGSSSGGSSSSGASAGCSGAALCDGFEGAAAGGAPDAARWAITARDCSGSGKIVIDGAQAHSGSHSARVDGGSGYCNHVFMSSSAIAGLGSTVYTRFFVRFEAALGSSHVTFLAMRDAANGNKDLRMGGQSGILMFNRETDDATLPALSPAGIALSVAFQPNRWTCVESRLDQATGKMETWVDGTSVPGLVEDGTPTRDVDEQWLQGQGASWRPTLSDFRLGWESYGGPAATLWFDDVALSSQRIGCGT